MASNSPAVDRAILAQLSADAELVALVNGAIYMEIVPENLTRYVVVSNPIHLDEPMFGGTAYEESEYWVQALVTGSSVEDADAAEARIVAALHFQEFPVEGYALMRSRRLGRIAFSDRDDLNRPWRHRGARFGVMVHEQAAPPPPSAYADIVLADGAIHYWRLGEASGAVAADEVGGAPGTINGGVTLGDQGPLADGSTAMTFDGATGFVLIPATALPAVCTIEFWVRPTSRRFVFGNNQYAGAVGSILCEIPDGNNNFIVRDWYGGGVVTSLQTYAIGAWLHCVVVCDGNAAALFVGGVLDTSGPFPRANAVAQPIGIGGGFYPGEFFEGGLAEVAVYPTALTPTQIAAHYNARTTGARSRRVLAT